MGTKLLLKSLTDQFFLDQQVGKVTRNNNILDLISCHDDWISSIDIINTSITDHLLLLVETNLPMLKNAEINYNPPRSKLEELDFNRANWKEIRLQFEKFPWFKELNNLGTEKCFLKITEIFATICSDFCPERNRKSFPKSKFLRTKFRKKNQSTLLNIESLIIKSHENEHLHKEYLAINHIKADPKYFFQYAKKFSSTQN